jgi:hypothetical protein
MNNSQVEIHENYKDFSAPIWVRNSITRLVDGLPAQYLNGLHSITLTNIGGLNHRRRRQKTIWRKRKVSVMACRGLYYQTWQGKPAMIELFIDKIIYRWPSVVLKVEIFQDMLLAGVLYHELGHHIHKAHAPEHREREDVAEDWRKKLSRLYFHQKYNWLKPLGFILKPLVALMLQMVRLIQGKKAKKHSLREGT